MRALAEAAADTAVVPRTAVPRAAAGLRRSGRAPGAGPVGAGDVTVPLPTATAPVTARRAPRSVGLPWRRLAPDEPVPSRTATA
ncbi:hypothetical protein AB0E77_24110 [Streptomyces sp. NPDC032940]|uniref:hypothetical protein n=1 Tax=Streptomyces sp. NPDC032940 TaxID=3155366 RepID=UPI00340B1E37